jgi:hypothetical protein
LEKRDREILSKDNLIKEIINMKIKDILLETSGETKPQKGTTDKKSVPINYKVGKDYYITTKGGKFFILDKDGKVTKKKDSLEDALDDILSATSDSYRKASFDKKVKMVDSKKSELIKWNNAIEKTKEETKGQKYGFQNWGEN